MEEKVTTVTEQTGPTTATVPTGVATATASTDLPAELRGWNWGAFFLNWIWGIGNRVWIALAVFVLAFIPVVGAITGLAGAIVLGLKGNEWAWKARKFESVEHFKKVQKIWAIWGLVIFVLGIILMATVGASLLSELNDTSL